MTYPPTVPGPPPGQVWPPNPTHPAGPSPKKSRMPWILAAGAVAVALVAGLAAMLFLRGDDPKAPAGPSAWDREQAANASPFKSAQRRCDEFQEGTRIADGGKTLVVDGAGETGSGLPVAGLECVVRELRMPESVKEHMFATRALDGRQTDTWPGFSASWSYHPDDGMDLVITAS